MRGENPKADISTWPEDGHLNLGSTMRLWRAARAVSRNLLWGLFFGVTRLIIVSPDGPN
jgi:hypothetical protein